MVGPSDLGKEGLTAQSRGHLSSAFASLNQIRSLIFPLERERSWRRQQKDLSLGIVRFEGQDLSHWWDVTEPYCNEWRVITYSTMDFWGGYTMDWFIDPVVWHGNELSLWTGLLKVHWLMEDRRIGITLIFLRAGPWHDWGCDLDGATPSS